MSVYLQPYVLYVDDDPHERELVRALAKGYFAGKKLETCGNIAEAQTFLTSAATGAHEEPGLPTLLLLDYNLGHQTGVELLAWLKTQPSMRFPVAIYSNCDNEADILACYRAGASYFLRKPVSFKRLQTLLDSIACCMTSDARDFEPLRLLEEYRAPSTEQPKGPSWRVNVRGI